MTNLLLLGFLPSGSEWIIIALVILLLFGGKKIPELMRGLGKGVKSFKDGPFIRLSAQRFRMDNYCIGHLTVVWW